MKNSPRFLFLGIFRLLTRKRRWSAQRCELLYKLNAGEMMAHFSNLISVILDAELFLNFEKNSCLKKTFKSVFLTSFIQKDLHQYY